MPAAPPAAGTPAFLFWDVGGVILSNGWDQRSRAAAVRRFRLPAAEFERRHAAMVDALETGRLAFDDYLRQLISLRTPRPDLDQFRTYIHRRSRPRPATLALLERLRRAGMPMGALNNESRELNEYRIQRFHLRRYCSVFCSSCYLGVRKPGPAIFRHALGVVQCRAARCVFVDDRPENAAAAAAAGMDAIHFRSARRLAAALRARGLRF